ncbi:AMP-binding protein [Brachybacterium sp. AOP25-B2-12]|uniref:AMP-binding protein n=1 Tax=Brachybacterium sp. AOP25-B2-12 TaxID=3457710 RepID=UPI004034BD7C
MSAPIEQPIAWTRPVPFSGTPASLAEHIEAISALMAGASRLWLAGFAPPPSLPPGFGATALVVPTSGSTGASKAVALSRAALVASHDATARLLADVSAPAGGRRRSPRAPGHGMWLPLLPPTHIAGIQVIARACRAAELLGRARPLLPSVLPALAERFEARSFARSASTALTEAEAAGVALHTSLVPTQLTRILEDPSDAGVRARALLARFDTVLVGGAAIDPALLVRARDRGIHVLTTYGASETAGGCVYDGDPLDGVALRIQQAADGETATTAPEGPGHHRAAEGFSAEGEGRLVITSPTLATGYLRPDGGADLGAFPLVRTADASTRQRMFVTSDLARLTAGRVSILGRADDVVVTGGRKVLPQEVERAIAADGDLDGQVAASVVVGVPDAQWGQRLVALVVPTAAADTALLPELVRTALRAGPLPRYAVPKSTLVLDALPRLGIGKIDRSAARREAISRGA